MPEVVLVHGGAGGWSRDPGRLRDAIAACERAAEAGRAALRDDGGAVDAVEAAVRVLEEAPMLNAGRGSYPNVDGTVEMDAMIMDGASLGVGAVAAVTRVLHPISLARRVMSDTPHTLLVAAGAEAFADRIAFPRCTNDDLIVTAPPAAAADTVGAVALDARGNIAAATSTGGIPLKLAGRVGDSPLPGSGAYADNATGAASATGDGEQIMKLVLSKHVCDSIGGGMSAQDACDGAVRLLAARLGGSVGLIAVGAGGEIGVACNTQAMPWACARDGGRVESGYASG
jgi:beta-aspartyl-peptidase (threonine type)